MAFRPFCSRGRRRRGKPCETASTTSRWQRGRHLGAPRDVRGLRRWWVEGPTRAPRCFCRRQRGSNQTTRSLLGPQQGWRSILASLCLFCCHVDGIRLLDDLADTAAEQLVDIGRALLPKPVVIFGQKRRNLRLRVKVVLLFHEAVRSAFKFREKLVNSTYRSRYLQKWERDDAGCIRPAIACAVGTRSCPDPRRHHASPLQRESLCMACRFAGEQSQCFAFCFAKAI